MFQVKDFIATEHGLVFAVVAAGLEQGRVRCFLRYLLDNGRYKKVNTAQANDYLKKHYPQYLYYSFQLAADLHAVPVADIVKQYQPKSQLQSLILKSEKDSIENDLYALILLLQQCQIDSHLWGVTGSLLLGIQNAQSDIDLVCYDLTVFEQCRKAIAQLINSNQLMALTDDDWRQSYDRRACSLSYSDYVWHEQRKFNKALINGRKFDISCVTKQDELSINTHYQKLGAIVLQVKVIDDSLTFAYPAEFIIEHETIKRVLCFTATYTGQAFAGELVEVSGLLEQSEKGEQRIIIGSSREADGEYIKCLNQDLQDFKIHRIYPAIL
ncbi:MAG: hypothetical protein WAX77_14485 [Methylococcaceae bacterium]